jgi:RHS repeat-associated protein
MIDEQREDKSRQRTPEYNANGRFFRQDQDSAQDASEESSAYSRNMLKIPKIELPKGGGALKGIDEKFQVNPSNGTASFSIPLPLSKARSDFMPALSLSYNSGSGNSVFGLGWNLGYVFIQRKTDKLLPRYEDARESDVFLISGAEDLVPGLYQDGGGNWVEDEVTAPTGEKVKRYRPRIEGDFARIEKITPSGSTSSYWKVTSKNNIVTIYGRSIGARIADPSNPDKVFKWLPELCYDDKGNCLEYEYVPEDFRNVPNVLPEKNRFNLVAPCANTYLKRVKYGNKNPYYANPAQPYNPQASVNPEYFFEIVLDYGDHDTEAPTPEVQNDWVCRIDPFSDYKAGFDIRTYRTCKRILLFHFFKELNDGINPVACLVRSLDFDYRYFGNAAASLSDLRNAEVDYPIAIRQSSYLKNTLGSYDKKSLPAVEFTYQELDWNKQVQTITSDNLVNAPTGLSQGYHWVDLWSEGISGILSEQANAWFYKSNLGNGEFSIAQTAIPKPSFIGISKGNLQLQEIEADGRKFIVSTEPPLRGYFEISDDDQWQPFTTFANVPNVDLSDPNTKFIDLNGDGRPDLVVSEENVFTWYPSKGILGYEGPEQAFKPFDEEKGPALVFADPTSSIFLANMSGSGLTDIVRIRNGEVCYWPNLGYGRFGAKVAMNFAPVFDTQDLFNPSYIHLADVSGTGATDILYLGKNKFKAWLNQSGNAWSEEVDIDPFPTTELPNQLSVIDLLGNGTACIVWSSPLPKYADSPMRYVDLMGGKKPYIVTGYVNNTGKEVAWEYKSSTYYYLQDKSAGEPWVTKLPFPVQCVSKVMSRDKVTRAYITSEYTYHHGYYDHAEREYRGFGMVEKTDTETFDQFVKSGASNIVDEPLHQAPVLTKTWYHTGAFFNEDTILNHFRDEYFQNPDFTEYHLPTPQLPDNVTTAKEMREAQRACKGMVIRQEIYGLDNIPGVSDIPYFVCEHNCLIQMPQPLSGNKFAVFLVTESEAISYYYERNSKDPRISHTLNIEIDPYGNVLQSAAVGYPRQAAVLGLPAKVNDEQQKLHISYTVSAYTNDIVSDTAYRLRQQCENSAFELTGVTPGASYFRLDELGSAFATASLIKYEDVPDGSGQKRPLKHARTLFLKDDLSAPLVLGQMGALGLTFESYRLTFTGTLLTSLYGTRVTPALLSEGAYIRSNDYKANGWFPPADLDDEWWIPSGKAQYPANAANTFYMPNQYLDPFGNITTVSYYADYHLLLQQVTDAMSNTTSVETFDWRVLAPLVMKGVNDNYSEVQFDILGFVVGTALKGKGSEADDFTGFVTDLADTDVANFFSDPVTYGPNLLQHATSRFVYDFSVTPLRVGSIIRETHYQSAVTNGIASKLQYSFAYSDGFGRVAMRKTQTKPGMAKELDGSNNVVEVDTTPKLRWVGDGRTVLNNKGNVVKKYEPYFSVTHEYEDDPQLVEIGVSPVMYYDPLGRLIKTEYPNGTFSKKEIQGWLQKDFDQNDTVNDSDWYTQRTTGSLSGNAQENQVAQKAAIHYDTPGVNHFDSLGRPFYTVSHNKFVDHTTHVITEQFYESYIHLDIEGNQRQMIDPRGNTVVSYDYDRLGNRDHSSSMDVGERWGLNDCMGKPIYGWDSKNQLFHTLYDGLRRPVQATVKKSANPEILYDQITYGEGQPNDKMQNLRGKVYQHFDQAGIITNASFDFKGNVLQTSRVFTVDYQNDIDWNAGPALQSEVFTTQTQYDVLSRPVRVVEPNNNIAVANISVPTYTESGKLQGVDVYLRGAVNPTHFVTNIDYNEKGQRQRIDYGNGASTVYKYDEQTFRLIALVMARNADPELFWDDRSKLTLPAYFDKVLQYLTYTFDPVGNITYIRDDAQQTIYFNNSRVDPSCDYTFDATYRLVQSLGREHIAQNQAPDPFDDFRMGIAQPGDGNQMQTYTQQYDYDAAGNMLLMHDVGSWSRMFTYSATNNQMLTAEAGGAVGTSFTYTYDEHGNMKGMPHLQSMEWDFKDRLRHTMVSVSGSISQQTWYCYESGGQRMRKVVQKGNLTEERLYLGNFEIFRRYRSNSLELERETLHVTNDKQRIAMVDTPTVKPTGNRETQLIRYQYSNHLGTACLEVDDAAQIISYEEYYAFGSTSYQATDQTREVAAKRYRYTSKERDEESGLYYHGARYYAPWLARWTSADPAGLKGGLNLYNYVTNNPVILHDPQGTDGEVCGVYDEEQLVCREEPCVPASLTPAVPTSAPSSPTAPRPRIRIQPQKPTSPVTIQASLAVPQRDVVSGVTVNTDVGATGGVLASGVVLGNYQFADSVANWLREQAREGAYEDLAESVESGYYSEQSLYTAGRYTPDQLVEFAEEGTIPEGMEFSHLESLASSPSVGANSELGVLTDEADHFFGQHGGNYANDPGSSANPDWEARPDVEAEFGENNMQIVDAETEEGMEYLGMTEGETAVEGTELLEGAAVVTETAEGLEAADLLYLLLLL